MSEPDNPARRNTTLFLAGELIESLRKPPEFWEAFQRVKFDSEDSTDYGGERVVVIVAKGEHANRIAGAYDREHVDAV